MNFMPFSAEAAPSNSMEGRSGEKSWEFAFSPIKRAKEGVLCGGWRE